MIVLDEQLLGRNIEHDIARWYRGAVLFITDLRPNTVIKDDVIPALLRKQNQPTFITINVKDFWRKIKIDNRFCAVCFALEDSKAREIPQLLKALFRHPEFNTKTKRMGKVLRITEGKMNYYTFQDKQIKKDLLLFTG